MTIRSRALTLGYEAVLISRSLFAKAARSSAARRTKTKKSHGLSDCGRRRGWQRTAERCLWRDESRLLTARGEQAVTCRPSRDDHAKVTGGETLSGVWYQDRRRPCAPAPGQEDDRNHGEAESDTTISYDSIPSGQSGRMRSRSSPSRPQLRLIVVAKEMRQRNREGHASPKCRSSVTHRGPDSGTTSGDQLGDGCDRTSARRP